MCRGVYFMMYAPLFFRKCNQPFDSKCCITIKDATMTEKQIEKIKLSIKRNRAALLAEKRKFGGFDDSAGRRYVIADLYLRIGDYSGALTYKKWFDNNFPDDCGDPLLSLNWAVAFHASGLIDDCKIFTIDTAFKNVYLHGLLIGRPIEHINKSELSNSDWLDFAQEILDDCKKVTTQQYILWLSSFVDSAEYQEPLNKFIALNKLLKDETDRTKRVYLLDHIRALKEKIKTKNK